MPSFTCILSQLRNDYIAGTFSVPCLVEGRSFVCGDSEVVTRLRSVASCEADARYELMKVSNDQHCITNFSPLLILIAVCLLSQL